MDGAHFLRMVQDSAFATAIRGSELWFPLIESVHVLAITLVVGSISIVDLRLLGFASTHRSVASLTADVLPFTWLAFICAVVTGAGMFISHAVGYVDNFEFRMKMLLLVLAGVNMLTFHGIMRTNPTRWQTARATPSPGKCAGLISLLLWIGIVAFGRWIGFAGVR